MEQKILNKVKGAFKRKIQAWVGGKNSVCYKMIDESSITTETNHRGDIFVSMKTQNGKAEYSARYAVFENGRIGLTVGPTYRKQTV